MAGRVIRVRAPHEPVSTKYQVLSIKYLELSQRVRSQFFEGVWKGTILYPPCTECGDMRGTFEDEGGREARTVARGGGPARRIEMLARILIRANAYFLYGGSMRRLRSDMTALVWIWQTRDSVTERTPPISASVRPS